MTSLLYEIKYNSLVKKVLFMLFSSSFVWLRYSILAVASAYVVNFYAGPYFWSIIVCLVYSAT